MASNSILAKMQVLISTNRAEFSQAMKQNTSALQSFEQSFSRLNNVIGGFGVGLSAGAIVGVFASATRSIIDFQKELSTVKAITGASGAEFEQLKKSALDLGASTRYTATQVAQLQVEFGRLGFTTKEILAATGATLNLATATGSDLSKAADVAGSTVRGFGLSADETRRVVDVMAESFNKSALGIENFSEAMKYVAPVAAQAGISVEETTAMLGTLADAGIRGSMAGTSLRKIISDLKGETGTLAEKLQKLADKGLTGAQAMDEVGRTAYASLLVLAKNASKTRELTQELNYAAGAGKEAAKIMGYNLAGDLTKLSSAYDGLVQSGGPAADVLRGFAQDLTIIITSLTSGSNALANFTAGWVKLVTIVPRSLASFSAGLSRLVSDIDEVAAATKKLDEKTSLIEANVKAAFANGREYVYEYIKSLAGVKHEKEIILAIYRKLGEEIRKEMEAAKPNAVAQVGLIKSVEDQLKKLKEAKENAFSVGAIAAFNKQIDDLELKLAELNSSGNLSNFYKQLSGGKAVSMGPEIKPPKVGGDNFLADMGGTTRTQADMVASAAATIVTAQNSIAGAYQASGQAMADWATASNIQHDSVMMKQQQAVDTAYAYGNAIGQTLGDAIANQESAANTLKKVTATIVQQFLKQALGAVIASAAKTGGPPPVIVALAAAGVAAISAMFSKIGASGGGGASAGLTKRSQSTAERVGSRVQSGVEMILGGEFRIKGTDLVLAIANQNVKSQRTG
jgi:hypothetical protein